MSEVARVCRRDLLAAGRPAGRATISAPVGALFFIIILVVTFTFELNSWGDFFAVVSGVSGQAVVTGVFPSPPLGLSILTARRFFINVCVTVVVPR